MKISPGKQALITGAAGGIGRAIALELARRGAALWLVDVNEAGFESVRCEVQALGAEVVAQLCDLSKMDEIAACVNQVRERWGGLDILINNAGIAYYGPTELMTAAQWQLVLAVNLLAPIELIRLYDPLMRSRTESHIVNLCSFFGLVPYYKNAAYQTSKYGLVGLSQALRMEAAGTARGVTAICPGFVADTNLFNAMEAPESRKPQKPPSPWITCTPEKVAKVTVRAIERNRGLVVITPLARLWWWGVRLAPWLMEWIITAAQKRKLRRARRKTSSK